MLIRETRKRELYDCWGLEGLGREKAMRNYGRVRERLRLWIPDCFLGGRSRENRKRARVETAREGNYVRIGAVSRGCRADHYQIKQLPEVWPVAARRSDF